jgi:hypothetical protein
MLPPFPLVATSLPGNRLTAEPGDFHVFAMPPLRQFSLATPYSSRVRSDDIINSDAHSWR